MNRTKFYKIEVVDGIAELDFLNNTLASFELTHDVDYYMVDIADIGRPDLISYTNYGTEYYWWIICLVNNIENPFTDFFIGQKLIIPSTHDIDGFYRKYTIR